MDIHVNSAFFTPGPLEISKTKNINMLATGKTVCGDGDDCPCHHSEKTQPRPVRVSMALAVIQFVFS
jgi:hypothetical protein